MKKKKTMYFGIKKPIATEINKIAKMVAMDNISSPCHKFGYFKETFYKTSKKNEGGEN